MEEKNKKRSSPLFVSRRQFIKGVGGGALATAAISAGALKLEKGVEAHAVAEAVESEREIITLRVNGVKYRADVEHRETLAELLRDGLGLTGVKIGCNRSECGACTVIMDGKAVYSCSQLALWADGKEIITIEGLAQAGELHPIQQAFIEYDAMQCGFCTPGQIMAAKALLDKNPRPTEMEVKRALSGNLCRCGAYNHIVEAVLAAAKKMNGEGGMRDGR